MVKKKLYVLTGFLGAGKTSLLTHILKSFEDKKIGIIQNEFGKLGIDGEILRKDGIEMIEINRGSIFCSCLKLNFVEALAEIGKEDLEYVFVESSGLADPSNILEILEAVKVMAGDVYELKGVICLVDAINFLEQMKDEETVERQLAHCHLAAVNKVDIVDNETLERVLEEVRKVNPICLITTCVNGEIDPDLLKEDLMAYNWKESEDSLNTVDNKPKTISLACEERLTHDEMMAFLKEALEACYRIKGFFELEDGWKQVDVVGRQIDIKPTKARQEPSELVFLSKVGLKVIKIVKEAWEKNVSHPMKLKN